MFGGENPVPQPNQPVSQSAERTVTTPVAAPPEQPERQNTVRMIRRPGSSLTPSIKDALAGKTSEKTLVDEVVQSTISDYEEYYEPFTKEQFEFKWKEFLGLISDRPNLIATLSNIPELSDGNKLLLKIGNSVQEEEIRLVKPELVGFLRRELKNSGIEMNTVIERVETERTHYNDSEKLQILMQKNPELFELKQKFNLDFNA